MNVFLVFLPSDFIVQQTICQRNLICILRGLQEQRFDVGRPAKFIEIFDIVNHMFYGAVCKYKVCVVCGDYPLYSAEDMV